MCKGQQKAQTTRIDIGQDQPGLRWGRQAVTPRAARAEYNRCYIIEHTSNEFYPWCTGAPAHLMPCRQRAHQSGSRAPPQQHRPRRDAVYGNINSVLVHNIIKPLDNTPAKTVPAPRPTSQEPIPLGRSGLACPRCARKANWSTTTHEVYMWNGIINLTTKTGRTLRAPLPHRAVVNGRAECPDPNKWPNFAQN